MFALGKRRDGPGRGLNSRNDVRLYPRRLRANQRIIKVSDINTDRARALQMIDVSRETLARLDQFVDVLLQWQQTTNLIAPSTIPIVWTRHVADSYQLLRLAPGAKIWLDLGSGAGFPGMVLACELADIPGAVVHMVESNGKKARFLLEAVRQTGAAGIVHTGRIETMDPASVPDIEVVTARALAPLADLLGLVAPFLERGAKALLLKGQDVDAELTEATKYWNIKYERAPSITDPSGRILIVQELHRYPNNATYAQKRKRPP